MVTVSGFLEAVVKQVISEELVLPGVRFAVDAYVNFARRASWRAASSSLATICTWVISLDLNHGHSITLGLMTRAMNIFNSRLSQAHRDVEHGLTITPDSLLSHEHQQRMLEILQFKLDIL